MTMDEEAASWAAEEFGRVELGDKRRTARVVSMAERMAVRPEAKITKIFALSREREGAYRLLNNPEVPYECLVNSAGHACVRRSRAYDFVFVSIDGTSATLADPHGKKDFGSVGTHEAGARGLKLISALALSPQGEPLGVCAQRQWTRPSKPKKRWTRRGGGRRAGNAKQLARAKKLAREKQRRRMNRCVGDKETRHWLDVIQASKRRFAEEAPSTRCWFQMDRETDAWPILKLLLEERSTDLFTVRAAWNRRLVTSDTSRLYLREVLATKSTIGSYELDVAVAKARTARRAHIEMRVASVVVDACDQRTSKHYALPLNVVWAREVGTTPSGEKPIEWLLLTNHAVDTVENARLVVFGYTQRWKIEEVHKTWKSGGCQIEQSQLHTAAAAMKLSTLLFTVAVRTERIKHLARTSPEQPASVALSPHEIQALLLLKRQQKARTETVPDTMPTIGQAARWIADLGGYTGKSSGGPFGSITLGRGLAEVISAGKVIQELDREGKLKM